MVRRVEHPQMGLQKEVPHTQEVKAFQMEVGNLLLASYSLQKVGRPSALLLSSFQSPESFGW